jgi:hypothetical protein
MLKVDTSEVRKPNILLPSSTSTDSSFSEPGIPRLPAVLSLSCSFVAQDYYQDNN